MFRQLSAIALIVGLGVGTPALCAGWQPTPEARMACCSDARCPMHERESRQSGSHHYVLTQAEADACCASSEPEQAGSSTPTFAAATSFAILGPGTVLPVSLPPLVVSDHWRTTTPIPTASIPKHVLLSVFLV